jgi:hypothetical protein
VYHIKKANHPAIKELTFIIRFIKLGATSPQQLYYVYVEVHLDWGEGLQCSDSEI